jgi:hypothetical protein
MEKYTKYFGEPTKMDSKTYTYVCPLCREEGNDNSGDNLKIKVINQLITCFASKKHTEILRNKYKSINISLNIKCKTSPIEFNEDKIKFNTRYLKQCQKCLNESYNYLISHRGFNVSILKELGLGIDLKKKVWVFPVYHHLTNKVIGFEYRDIKMLPRKKGGIMWHEEGTFSCLAQLTKKPKLSYSGEKKILLIMEGFIDAYSVYHHCKEKEYFNKLHICTPSCGVQTIPELINQVKPKSYCQIRVCLDKGTEEVKKKIKECNQPVFFEELPEGYKDFGEWFTRNIK